jgi:hypothetical protein
MCFDICPWMLTVEVHDAIMSKSCLIFEQHEGQKERLLAHCCRSHWQNCTLFQGNLVVIGLALTVDIKDTGVAHGGPTSQMGNVFCSCNPPHVDPRMSSNISQDSVFQLWLLDWPSSSWFCYCEPNVPVPNMPIGAIKCCSVWNLVTGKCILVHMIFHNLIPVCRIWGSHAGEYEDGCVLGCSAVKSGRSLPTFQRSLLPPSSGRWVSRHTRGHSSKMKSPRTHVHRDIFNCFCAKNMPPKVVPVF